MKVPSMWSAEFGLPMRGTVTSISEDLAYVTVMRERRVSSGSIRDITERKQNEELRTRFLEKVISAEEAERRRIARELHDETSQSLTSLMVALRAVEAALPTEDLRLRLEEIRKLAGGTLEEVGRLARGLHPSVLDDLGSSRRLKSSPVTFHGLTRSRLISMSATEVPANGYPS